MSEHEKRTMEDSPSPVRMVWRRSKRSKNRRRARDKSRQLANGADLINKAGVASMLRTSTRTIERLIRAGRFPPGLKFNRYVRWRKSELEIWIAAGSPKQWDSYFKPKSA